MPVLYNLDLSPYAARVRLAIRWKGLEDEIAVEAPPGGLKSEAYLALNPMGKVPALKLDDGFCLPESEPIVEYLDDQYPERSLRPADPLKAAKARLCARIADLYIAPGLAPLFLNADPASRDDGVIDTGFETLSGALGHLDRHLDPKGPWASGGRPSGADCALAPVLWFLDWADGLYRRETLTRFARCERVFRTAQADAHASAVFAEMGAALKARFG